MIVIDLHDRAKMDAYRAAMEPWAKGKISMFYSSPHYLEHVPEHVSKGHAVKKTLRASSDSACQHRGCRRSGK